MEGSRTMAIERVENGRRLPVRDRLAVEAPLEIQLGPASAPQPLTLTLRTPGHDLELALGFLWAEGFFDQSDQVLSTASDEGSNRVRVEIAGSPSGPVRLHPRAFPISSSCGACGKSSLEALHTDHLSLLPEGFAPRAQTLLTLPNAARQAQQTFQDTGGLHGAALFDSQGHLLCAFEDVGRHNAVDKVLGHQLRLGRLPLHRTVLLVSGRASFELVQKAIRGGIPVLAAVGAPSTLAVELARRFNLTLVGFLREGRFNIYHDVGRVQ